AAGRPRSGFRRPARHDRVARRPVSGRPWRRDSTMNFCSDNVAGIAPEILAAIAAANDGREASYGEDAVTRRVERRLAEIFEHEVAVFPVATGTAANALALAGLA